QVIDEEGRLLGSTPLLLRLSAGSHRLLVGGVAEAFSVRAGAVSTSKMEEVKTEKDAGIEAPPPPHRTKRPAVEGDAEAIYRRAEAAMARGDREAAVQDLTLLVREHGADSRAAAALYDLARLSWSANDPVAAREYLRELSAQGGDPSLEESAHHLRCR